MKTDIALLKNAVEKYIETFGHHQARPRNFEALHEWDAADAELTAVINNDETNIIIKLLKRAEKAEAELAKLKGDAVPVPVAWGTMQQDWPDEDRSLFLDKDIAESYSQNCYPLTPLFTHAQPVPVVVLPTTYWTFDDDNNPVFDADEVIAALEKSGVAFKYADGEGE